MIQENVELSPKVFSNIRGAMDIMRAVRRGEDPAVEIPNALRAELSRGAVRESYGAMQYAAGSRLGRLWNELQAGKNPAALAARGVSLAGQGVGKVAEKSFDLFELHEGMSRAMAYLYGYDKALSKGLTTDAAQGAGLEAAFSSIQDLSQLTPTERSIIRQVIPFYGFTQHLIRRLWDFPADHPYRAAIFSTIARMEMDDHGSALPESLRSMLPIGGEDAEGNQRAISFNALNPFSDAGDMLTFAGFVSATNPVFKTIAQQLGLDTLEGTADLNPNVHYDPSTGGMRLDAGNPVLQLLYNTIPQSQLLGELIGTNREYHELARTNPDAARRAVLSQAGVPVMVRNVNFRQGYIRSELDRAADRQAVLVDALKTGDDSQARLWPGLQGLVNQIRTLETGGALSPYAAPSPDFAKQYAR
jgi:hypothetical protein